MSTARRQTVIDAITKNQDAYLKFVSEFIQQPSEAPKEGKAEVLDAQLGNVAGRLGSFSR